jgi:cytochrome P450 family 619
MITAIVGVIVILVLLWNISESRKRRALPPGPTPLPLIGNLHQLPKQKAYIKFTEWIPRYGPLMSFKLGSRNLVVLSKASMVRE